MRGKKLGWEIFWYLVRTKKQSFIMSETWEQCKLEESFDFLQNNTLSRAEL